MAITTIDGALAGMQPLRPYTKVASPTPVVGRPQSLYALAGAPGAGAFNTTLNGGTYSSTSAIPSGILPHTDPGSGNSYLARLSANASQSCVVMLCDRLWDDQIGATITTSQSITFPGLPSRDAAGSSNGDGCLAALEVQATTSATAATLTSFTYTNQSGSGSRAGTLIDTTTAAAGQVGMNFRIALQAGDTGIRSIQSIQLGTAWTSGTVGLVMYRVLAEVEIIAPYVANAIDALTGGFARLCNGVCPYIMVIPSAAAAITLSGAYTETQG